VTRRKPALRPVCDAAAFALTVCAFLIAVSFVFKGEYNPFIYFNF
jgi:hypothetical protein